MGAALDLLVCIVVGGGLGAAMVVMSMKSDVVVSVGIEEGGGVEIILGRHSIFAQK